MSDFDLQKITGNEPPLITDDDKDAEIERLRRELAEAKERRDEWIKESCRLGLVAENAQRELAEARGLLKEARGLIVERGESTDVPLQFRQHGWLKRANEIIAAVDVSHQLEPKKSSRIPDSVVIEDQRQALAALAAHNELLRELLAEARNRYAVHAYPLTRIDTALAAETVTAADQPSVAACDATRLDWLERNLFSHHWSGTIGQPWEWHMAGPYRHTLRLMRGNSFREAIDAAMTTSDKPAEQPGEIA